MAHLEAYLSQFVTVAEHERASRWALGDLVCEAIIEFGKDVIGKFAETGRCSKEHISQLARIAKAFPQEHRYPDVDWSFYRGVYNAAKRTGKHVLEVLEEAMQNEWSLKDLAAYGKENQAKARLSRKCEWCDTKVFIEADGGLAGEKIFCPVCLIQDGEERLLGVLE